jgi:hypothetical protein
VEQRVPPEQYPWWVRLVTRRLHTKESLWFWVVVEFGIAALFFAYAAANPWLSPLVVLLVGPLPLSVGILLVATIWWMDRHEEWPK